MNDPDAWSVQQTERIDRAIDRMAGIHIDLVHLWNDLATDGLSANSDTGKVEIMQRTISDLEAQYRLARKVLGTDA